MNKILADQTITIGKLNHDQFIRGSIFQGDKLKQTT
jgi:hypothetical protein